MAIILLIILTALSFGYIKNRKVVKISRIILVFFIGVMFYGFVSSIAGIAWHLYNDVGTPIIIYKICLVISIVITVAIEYKIIKTEPKKEYIEDNNQVDTNIINCRICGKKTPYNENGTCEECHKKVMEHIEKNREENQRKKVSCNSEEDKIELTKKYKELLDEGIITEEEFNKKKKELLDL